MAKIAPEGPVYQAGTLSGNPLAVAAGLACLKALAKPGAYERLEAISPGVDGRARCAEARGSRRARTLNRVGSMFTAFFTERARSSTTPSAKKADTASFGRFFHAMLDEGVYLPPSQFEAAFVSLAMGEPEIEHTLAAARQAFRAL